MTTKKERYAAERKLVYAVKRSVPDVRIPEGEAKQLTQHILGYIAEGIQSGADLALVNSNTQPVKVRILKLRP